MNKISKSYLKERKKMRNMILQMSKRFHYKKLIVLRVNQYYEFHVTSKNLSHLLNKKKRNDAVEVISLYVNKPNELKNHLCNEFLSKKIKPGSNLYDVTIQQIIECIKDSDYRCYSLTKNGVRVGEIFFDGRGKIFDTLTKAEMKYILQTS